MSQKLTGFTGRKHSEEAKLKMSEAKLKNPTKYWLGKNGPTPSEETREKMRQAAFKSGNRPPIISGEKSHLWRGGVTPLNKKIRSSLNYKKWRNRVFERDNFTCVHCGQVGGTLNADHIKPFSLYPELRFDIENGRTLCHPCHTKTETYGHKIRSYPLIEQEYVNR